ncbi:MAG TPA: hypothetical protein PLN21_15115 [Gemmatales bacterium]|nr:hypothetical protein [Gemmatales bacterium]
MRINVILDRVQQKPFQPFTLYLADGRSFEIRHRETLALLKTAVYLMLVEEQRMIVIDPLLIITMEWNNAEGVSLPSSMKPRQREFDDDDQQSED